MKGTKTTCAGWKYYVEIYGIGFYISQARFEPASPVGRRSSRLSPCLSQKP